MSEAPKEEAVSQNAAPARIRSRFPKAQPNLAISSGIARIRRLSGHYSSPTSNSSVTTHLAAAAAAATTHNEDVMASASFNATIIECKTPPPRSLTPSAVAGMHQQSPLSRHVQLM